MSKERLAGVLLLVGIVVSAVMALGGYRSGHDEVMALGIIGMVVLAFWAFAKPGVASGDAGYSGLGTGCRGSSDADHGGADGGGGE